MPTYTTKGFTGQYADTVAGVFLSADSVQGNVQGMNPYGYVGGNPETRNDPTGHCFLCIAAAIVGIVVAAAVIGNVAAVAVQGAIEGKAPSWQDYRDAAEEGVVEGLGAVAIGILFLTVPEAVIPFTATLAGGTFIGSFIVGLAVGVVHRINGEAPADCPSGYTCTPNKPVPTPTTGSPTIRLPGSHTDNSTSTLPGVSKGMLEAKYMGSIGL